MPRRDPRQSTIVKMGMPPGTLVFLGDPEECGVRVRLVEYDAHRVEEHDIFSTPEIVPFLHNKRTTWLEVAGLSDMALMKAVGQLFKIHPLILEDVLNPQQRPKCEEYPDHVFVVLRLFEMDSSGLLRSEQLSLVVGRDFVVSFSETLHDVFAPLRERLRNALGNVRGSGPDYLAYALIDIVVDHYFLIVERIEEHLDSVEDRLVEQSSRNMLAEIYRHRRDALSLRRATLPLREALAAFAKIHSVVVAKETALYLRDAQDHTERVIEAIDHYRESVATLTTINLARMSEQLNQQTKVLTIIATIFIPLTFVAGVYGMNFDHMPELRWRFGYYAALGLMALVAAGMLVWFRRRRWL
ncbi:MAG: magnesium/cobalt transporter CorA [Candidatus Sumerlaeia bacterium]|nr:magnesium/cobalt transporter CorA [Candidatus Sumerlaeia bacterium]